MFLYKLHEFTHKITYCKPPIEHIEVYCGDIQVAKIVKRMLSDTETEYTIIWAVDVKAIKQTKETFEEAISTIKKVIQDEVEERMSYCKYFIKPF